MINVNHSHYEVAVASVVGAGVANLEEAASKLMWSVAAGVLSGLCLRLVNHIFDRSKK